MKEDNDQTYELTPKGLLSLTLGVTETLNQVMDSLELYMRRHGKGIVVHPESNELRFVSLEPVPAEGGDEKP